MNGLREYIRLLLEAEKRDDGKEILAEPDESEEEKYQADEQSAGGVPGVTTPLGTGPTYPADDPDRKKRKPAWKANASGFGGATLVTNPKKDKK